MEDRALSLRGRHFHGVTTRTDNVMSVFYHVQVITSVVKISFPTTCKP